MEHAFARINDITRDDGRPRLPIDGYEGVPLVPLEVAVEPLVSLFPDGSLLTRVTIAKQRCQNPANDLSPDESASIMLYTIEWAQRVQSLYYILNKTLREENRELLKPWFAYLRLLIDALVQLPLFNDVVYRGVKRNLTADYPSNTQLTWWSFSSCTSDFHALECEEFCGTNGPRTIFHIKSEYARDIRNHSYYGYENEILLLPGRYLSIKNHANLGNGLYIIHLEEIDPPYKLISLPSVRPWRQIRPGASLLGKCTSSECQAYRKEVTIPIDIECYDIIKDPLTLAQCPMCRQHVNISKLGFNRCQWKLHGIVQQDSVTPPKPFLKEWTPAPRHSLAQYDLSQKNVLCWRQLMVEITSED